MRYLIGLAAIVYICGCGGGSSGGSGATLVCPATFELKDSRLIGMDILNPSETGDFNASLAKAQECGIDFLALHLEWDQIETAPSTYTDPFGALASFDALCTAQGLKFSLTIRPIDLTGKTVPADLSSTRFNTTAMKDRFKALMDYVFTQISYTHLTSLQIGNEIDGYDISGEDPAFWADYGEFLFDMNAYADANYPGLKIGFTCTFKGVTTGVHASSGVFEALAAAVDVVGMTYYVMAPDFSVGDINAIDADMQAMVDKFTGAEIFLQEVGCHTSLTCGGSQLKQAQFICNFFHAWDTHRADITLTNFLRLHDLSRTDAENLAIPYGVSDEKFIEYLRTLGLRTHAGAGTNKMGFNTLKDHAAARGW